jgi:hypothetical protein
MELKEKQLKYTRKIVDKYPTYRDDGFFGHWRWLEGRYEDDNAEGLWRVHNKIYDLNEFAKLHPGGRDWIEMTKVSDFIIKYLNLNLTNNIIGHRHNGAI